MLVFSPILPSIPPIGKNNIQSKNRCNSLFRWVFEKYDGIRGFWNPLKKAMFARTGKKFDLPQEVIDDMPSDLFLDGELWYSLPPSITFLPLPLAQLFIHVLGLGGTTFKNQ